MGAVEYGQRNQTYRIVSEELAANLCWFLLKQGDKCRIDSVDYDECWLIRCRIWDDEIMKDVCDMCEDYYENDPTPLKKRNDDIARDIQTNDALLLNVLALALELKSRVPAHAEADEVIDKLVSAVCMGVSKNRPGPSAKMLNFVESYLGIDFKEAL